MKQREKKFETTEILIGIGSRSYAKSNVMEYGKDAGKAIRFQTNDD
jgi:hypothetical protein